MKENQRIRLSKKMLKDSLVSLLYEKSVHKISVIEICNRAQINRTTFYKYYGNQYDLLEDIENDVLTRIDGYVGAINGSMDDTLQQCTNIITYVNDNIDICRVLFDNNIDPEFPGKLVNLPCVKQSAALFETKFGKETMEYTKSFVLSGGFSMIRRWMNKEDREPPEEIANLFSSIIAKILFVENPSL